MRKTASEVGGAYFDFHLAIDGTLTVAVGIPSVMMVLRRALSLLQ
jgi:hypothetical protein